MPKVLVAPLDWGLGHATRCIPIIKELVNQRCTVIIAASGAQKALLQKEFPTIRFIEIPGYDIKYGKNRAFTILRLMAAIPKILIRINRENRWLRRFVQADRPDLVISDNRYGLHIKGVVCVFITHQLRIKTPFGAVAEWLLERMNYSLIDRFSVCWVPDMPGADNLAGELSHPLRMPAIPVRYIGWLSRLGEVVAGDADYDLLVLLSGPEPQRTILEQVILEQAAGAGYKMVLVRGLPSGGGGRPLKEIPGVVFYDHLPTDELGQLIGRSQVLLSRSGYSTVMELSRLGKKAILIPTPGQAEQEYLGRYLAEKGFAVCVEQKGLSLSKALIEARGLKKRAAVENELLNGAVREILGNQSGSADLG